MNDDDDKSKMGRQIPRVPGTIIIAYSPREEYRHPVDVAEEQDREWLERLRAKKASVGNNERA